MGADADLRTKIRQQEAKGDANRHKSRKKKQTAAGDSRLGMWGLALVRWLASVSGVQRH